MKRFKIEPTMMNQVKCWVLSERDWVIWPVLWTWDILSVATDIRDLRAIILHLETKPEYKG